MGRFKFCTTFELLLYRTTISVFDSRSITKPSDLLSPTARPPEDRDDLFALWLLPVLLFEDLIKLVYPDPSVDDHTPLEVSTTKNLYLFACVCE